MLACPAGYHQDRRVSEPVDWKIIYRFPEDGISPSYLWIRDPFDNNKEYKFQINAGQVTCACLSVHVYVLHTVMSGCSHQ